MKYLGWLWRNTKGIRLNTVIRIVVGILRIAFGLMMVWFCRQFIDVTIRKGTDRDIIQMIVILVITVVGGILLRQLFFYMSKQANIHQTNLIRIRIFSRLFSRGLYDGSEFHSGDISSRLAKDIEVVSDATTDIIPQLIVTGSQLIGAFLLMRSMDARLAWMLLLSTPVAIFFAKMIARKLRGMTLEIRKEESRIQMQIQETMEHNAVLRSLRSEQWVTKNLENKQERLKCQILRRTRFTIVTRVIFASVFGLGYLLAFVWGGLQLRNGAITFGVMTSFLQLVSQIQNPILTLLNTVPQLINATASVDRLEELEGRDLCSESVSYPWPLLPVSTTLGLRLDNVSFHYTNSDQQVLKHVTYSFEPGSKTALMGPTGIGKTTLFRLMLALVRPDHGKVAVFHGDHEYQVSDKTRDYFVFVPQGNTLMSGTVRYNLLLAKPDATEQELRKALHTAAADFVFDMPDGLDTELGERASGLSEGQAQRVAIARGILRPGSILLLDEISSSLDEQTEKELFSRLFSAYPEKTMLFITHRPAVSELCDHILNLDRFSSQNNQ